MIDALPVLAVLILGATFGVLLMRGGRAPEPEPEQPKPVPVWEPVQVSPTEVVFNPLAEIPPPLPPLPEPPKSPSIRLLNTRGKFVTTVPMPRRRTPQLKHKNSVYVASHQTPDGDWVYRRVGTERSR